MWPKTKQNLAIERNEALMHATLWMNPKNIPLRSHTGVVAERSYPRSEVRSSSCTLLEQPAHEEISHVQGKRNPSKMVGVVRASEGRHAETILTEN